MDAIFRDANHPFRAEREGIESGRMFGFQTPGFLMMFASRGKAPSEETVSSRATAALLWFHKGPTEGEMVREAWYAEREAPEWIRELSYAGHDDGTPGGQFPNDHRYEFIVEALNALANAGDGRDSLDEARDSLEADIYTADLTAWLASRVDRYGYCDEAVSEMGGEGTDTLERMRLGQLHEKHEVFDAVRAFLETQAEEMNATQENAREARESDETSTHDVDACPCPVCFERRAAR